MQPEASEEATVIKAAPSRRRAKGPAPKRCPGCEQIFSGEARFCPFDGDLLIETPDYNPSADPLIGTTIDGRYEVIDVLGEGGMGTVYEVRHTTLGRRFALKVLRRDIADAEHTARFIQEAKAAAAIGHPNIVAVSDFGELRLSGPSSPPMPYFVMEFLTGISLAQLLRAEKTLQPARAASILLQCASGLAAAHAAGVIHRDLKPDNVFLTRTADREFVKLLDFGVAKIVGQGRLTRAGMVFGTPHYMSPEQAAGQNIDHRADIYALGVILYQCFAGRVPFEADTYMGVLTKHMFATPEPIDRVAPDASKLGALGPIAMRCLAKDPADRYANMAEVAAAIEQAALSPSFPTSERPRSEKPLGLSDAPVSTPGLHPVLAPRTIGLAALVVGLIGVLSWVALHKSAVDPAPGPAASAVVEAKPADSIVPLKADPPPSAAPLTPTGVAVAPTAPKKSDPSPRPTGVAHPGKTHKGGDVVDPWSH